MSPVLSKKTLRELRGVLHDWAVETQTMGDKYTTRLCAEIDAALKPKRAVRAAKVRRVAKQKTRKEEWAEIRAAVLARSHGRCEWCGRTAALECDHMFGGGGRRKSLESFFTVWALCSGCHRQKTRNEPSAAEWLGAFIKHCVRHEANGMGSPGFFQAANIAQARLESLSLQGRAGGAP